MHISRKGNKSFGFTSTYRKIQVSFTFEILPVAMLSSAVWLVGTEESRAKGLKVDRSSLKDRADSELGAAGKQTELQSQRLHISNR